jgi:hypothetical protein
VTYISRDPFAREELHRERVHVADGRTCDFCGNVKVGKTGRKALYRYSTHTDGGRIHEHRGLFCGKSCHDDIN